MKRSASGAWKRLAGKKRWAKADAEQVVAAWRASGLPIQAFAREYGIGAWRLRWWAPRVEAEAVASPKRATSGGTPQPTSNATPRFVPAVVATAGTCGDGPAIVVRLPDGIEVELRNVVEVEPTELGRLVAELRRAGS